MKIISDGVEYDISKGRYTTKIKILYYGDNPLTEEVSIMNEDFEKIISAWKELNEHNI